MSTSKIARRRVIGVAAAAAAAAASSSTPKVPDAVLRDDWRGELGSPRQVVSEVEARVFNGRVNKNNTFGSRAKAADLHREADRLHFKGDYESALVLYHRAAKLYPRESTHLVAAKRTEIALKRAANPSRRLGRMLKEAKMPGQEAAVLDAEAAARRAKEIVNEAEDPVQEIPRILRYLDAREDFWRISSPSNTPRIAQSRSMRRQLSKCVRSTVKDVEAAQDSEAIRKLSDELLSLVSLTDEPNKNQIDALGYLATKQLALGRHDRAVDLAAKMLFRARTNNDTTAMVKALEMIGRVHLTFGHLSALVKVWQRLVGDLSRESVAQAWLFHDIGRCQFELNEYNKAHESAKLCIERAESINCKKWMLRGYLLSGQSLLKLARLAEAVAALKVTARIAAEVERHKDEKKEKEEDDREQERSILLYVHGLIDQVTGVLRQISHQKQMEGRLDGFENGDESDIEEVTLTFNDEHQIANKPEATIPIQRHSHEEVSRLLARTRALRGPRDNGHPEVPPVDLSDLNVGDSMDTSRTRVIRKQDDLMQDELTLGPDELIPLADFSVEEDILSGDEGQNFVEGETEAKSKTYLKLTSRSVASSLESPREYQASSSANHQLPIRTNILSDYLRSLESQEFLAQERKYIAGIKSTE